MRLGGDRGAQGTAFTPPPIPGTLGGCRSDQGGSGAMRHRSSFSFQALPAREAVRCIFHRAAASSRLGSPAAAPAFGVWQAPGSTEPPPCCFGGLWCCALGSPHPWVPVALRGGVQSLGFGMLFARSASESKAQGSQESRAPSWLSLQSAAASAAPATARRKFRLSQQTELVNLLILQL